ncbi:MAG TPA: CpsB/CapC family capsule biosynthesis tyrosine phosphatase [Thermoanaerobaculia bacterium]|nr:CpsB/CapC family capsule biosynthesis tyrosine phosphatase [Thermoanaerobaculia bacterium]
MIDIHSHVLPGIDDGADDLSVAAAMCRLAAEDGCEAMVMTPHQRTPTWENTDRDHLDALRSEVEAATGGRPRLYPGGEIRVDDHLLDELGQLPVSGLVPLADSRYLLLEMDRWLAPADPVSLTHELVVDGWVPIYAHPEMIPYLAEDLDLMRELVAAGALFQVTAMSLVGDFGRRPRQTTCAMLDAGLVHFVASDSHGTDYRPPGLAAARRELARRWGEPMARALTEDHPRAVVEDRPLEGSRS